MNTPTLLLCIDLQTVFLRAMADADALQRRCAFTIAAAQGLDVPIIFTEQVPAKLGGTASELLALAPRSKVFAKESFSAFGDERIADAIAAHSPSRLLICGLETPVCIYQSASAARDKNHAVTILSDAVGARRPPDAEACLVALRARGVEVLPSETVFYAMLGSVQHPFFKSYTQLVKDHV